MKGAQSGAMLSVIHEIGATGWFSCNPNKAAIVQITFGRAPLKASLLLEEQGGNMGTRLLPWVSGGQTDLPETPAMPYAKTQASTLHHSYLQNMENKSVPV